MRASRNREDRGPASRTRSRSAQVDRTTEAGNDRNAFWRPQWARGQGASGEVGVNGMTMRWSMVSVRIRWYLSAISGGNFAGAERRTIGGFRVLNGRSSVANQHRLSVRSRHSFFVAQAVTLLCGWFATWQAQLPLCTHVITNGLSGCRSVRGKFWLADSTGPHFSANASGLAKRAVLRVTHQVIYPCARLPQNRPQQSNE